MSDLINSRSLMEPQFPGKNVTWDAWELAFGKGRDDYLKQTKKCKVDDGEEKRDDTSDPA